MYYFVIMQRLCLGKSKSWQVTLREHSGLTCPVGNLADKVEEEISLGNTDHFVAHLYEEAETLV